MMLSPAPRQQSDPPGILRAHRDDGQTLHGHHWVCCVSSKLPSAAEWGSQCIEGCKVTPSFFLLALLVRNGVLINNQWVPFLLGSQ